ncbi:MAG TPA: peptidylprolyl isomerase [Candidatus Bathyarchaeia archaeon]|nr:peptidylprolyl isomerase [Candidatus Bathyarchaeia archaeon]
MSKNEKLEKHKIWIVAGAIAGVIFAFLLVLILGVYKFNWSNRFFVSATKAVPFPAVYVRGAGMISVGEIKADDAAIKKFYESQEFEKIGMRVDFSTDQGQKRLAVKEKEIINKVIENAVIENLAKKRGIKLTDADVSKELESNIQQFGNKDNLMSDLARLYGWTLADFEQKVVKPELYSEKLADTYASSLDKSSEQSKAKSLFDRVTTKKEDFAKVAKEASDGQSALNGGDLGWSTKNQLIQQVADKAYSMKAGEISQPIESQLGFHILKLMEKKTDNGEDMVHLSQIFVKKPTYADWLKDQMKNYPVSVFLKQYQWNANNGQVEFRDPAMKTFEQQLPANSEGDPSVF